MAKKQPTCLGLFEAISLIVLIPGSTYLMHKFSISEAPLAPFLRNLFVIMVVMCCVPIVFIILYAIQKYRANKLIASVRSTAELPTNLSASLELKSHCKHCESQRIIKGKLTDNREVFLKSPDLKSYSRFWARSITDGMPKPLYEIEDLYFNYCMDCGHLGGFTSVEMLQLSLKAHATEAALLRLNLVNDLDQQ